jgi:uncharacterized protein (TIGR03067 family)
MKYCGILVFVSFVFLSADPGLRADDPKQELAKLQGRWQKTKQEADGAPTGDVTKMEIIFEDNRFLNLYNGNPATKGTFTIDPSKDPKLVTLTLTIGSAGTQYGIYRFTPAGELEICVTQPGRKGIPPPSVFDTKKGTPGAGSILWAFKKSATPGSITTLDGPPAPAGWKSYSPVGSTFTIWMPDVVGGKSERNKTLMPEKGMIMRFASVVQEMKDGRSYEATSVSITGNIGRFGGLKGEKKVELLRDVFVESTKGTLSDEKELKQGRVPGLEFVIKTRSELSKFRVYNFADRFFVAVVSGTKAQIDSKEATGFLESFRLPNSYTGLGKTDK